MGNVKRNHSFRTTIVMGGRVFKDFYGLDGREEARAYIEHPILRERLIKAFQILLDSNKSIYETFSPLGVMKIRACTLLFSTISNDKVFKQVINKYRW